MEATSAAMMNVRETWPLYDTAQIGPGMSSPAGYASYAALANLEDIPFFSVRNKAEVGLAYTNKDNKDSMPFVYYIQSIGVHMLSAPRLVALPAQATDADVAEMNSVRIFESLLPYHFGVILKIQEDEKLQSTVEYTPPGMGAYNYTAGATAQIVQMASMGWPSLGNRFTFIDPIAVPRTATLTVSLKPSAYAKYILAHMVGPLNNLLLVDNPAAAVPGPFSANENALIRVTLNGMREVQQRGALHR